MRVYRDSLTYLDEDEVALHALPWVYRDSLTYLDEDDVALLALLEDVFTHGVHEAETNEQLNITLIYRDKTCHKQAPSRVLTQS